MNAIRATIYYILLFMYAYMYTIIAEITYFIETIFIIKFDNKKETKKIGWYNKLNYYYAHAYLSILKIVGVKIYYNGSINPGRKIFVSNHRSKLDGIIIQNMLCIADIDTITVVKKSIKNIPLFGSIGRHSGSIFIERTKSIAEKILIEKSKESIETNQSILLFPEGATMSLNSKSRSDRYAINNGLSLFKNVLVPRTTGFDIIQSNGKFDIVGNITIRYSDPKIPYCEEHSYLDIFKLFPKKVYIDIEYENNIGKNDLYNIFDKKDKKIDSEIPFSEYKECPYSKFCLFYNGLFFVYFYYLMFTVSFFRYVTLAISILSAILNFF